ncbi:P-loop containing nucleoside triphosphate hydrolase protein [Xylariomycetidae sp. FL0641]|nr:P-loop containing nucleoside triphosphate hydrolase protein [Xylariomycetidae sp. FL0641]
MDINSLLGSLKSPAAANATEAAANATPQTHGAHVNLVENLLPLMGLRGLQPVYRHLSGSLGFDPSALITVLGLLWAFNKVFRQLYTFIGKLFNEYLMSTIHVSSHDDIYMHLMKWLAAQPRMVNSRALTAETVSKTAWEDEDESNVARDKSGRYLNFSNQEARSPPQYIPAVGVHNFWWKGQYFRLQRKREALFDDSGSSGFHGNTFKDREDLIISCLWRSPEPIKKLLAHTKEQYFSGHHARTIVKRPSPIAYRRRMNWQQVADRPVRDIGTVVLDDHQKLQLLADVNEYIHPQTPRWYANRGIPLRRGYLFHGPPGTGKTSLSFALAGVFGLDIHVISLLEPSLTEEDLATLFGSLPRRCVVLLEDIDTAGLRRSPEEMEAAEMASRFARKGRGERGGGRDREQVNGDVETPNNWKVSDLARALKKDSSDDNKKGISLSGLLNAIDGVASHEGRVLIMTTNVPEALDDALIRPGRVDLQVAFTNATRTQAEELFVRMYRDAPSLERAPRKQQQLQELDAADEELPELARSFAQLIPDSEFSPAEIQGYLLKRKKHPRRALEEAENWATSLVEQKASKTKVLRVQ